MVQLVEFEIVNLKTRVRIPLRTLTCFYSSVVEYSTVNRVAVCSIHTRGVNGHVATWCGDRLLSSHSA